MLVPVKAYPNDSLRVVSFPRHINFYTKIGPSFSQVEISNPHLRESLMFEPNPQSLIGFGFSYSWLAIGFKFELPSEKYADLKYGKTQKFDFEAHYTMRRLVVDLTVKDYKGFYFSNPKTYIDGWSSGDPYPQMSDLETITLAASFTYVFSPDRYSSNAAYTFTNAMRRRGGSWMLGGFASISGVASDSSIVPAAIKQYVDPELDLKNVVYTDFGISIGYSYLLTIYKKYFISFTLLPGLSYQNITQQSSIDQTIKEYESLSVRTISRFSLGRNGDKYYWGLASYLESSLVNHHDTDLSLSSGHVELFFGYRFDTSNWKFMKKFDRVMHPRFLRFLTGNPPARE